MANKVKDYIVLFACLSLIVGIIWMELARADGDRIEPSTPISEQLAREAEDCRSSCNQQFRGKIHWEALPSMTAAPPDVYNRAYNGLWRCIVQCGQ